MKLNKHTNNTIELVGHGHPDRFADFLGEKILDEHLAKDSNAKVAVEILATRNSISLGGEITSKADIDYEKLVYESIEEIYGERWWPNYKEVKIYNHIEEQSPELSEIQSGEIVAGDQGVVYGYYNKKRFETIRLLYFIMERVEDKFDIAPDWKLLYNENELSISVCGSKTLHKDIRQFIMDWTSRSFAVSKTDSFDVIINPKGEWLVPGPLSDTGVVGRKLMIDTFGAGIPHGGGAFCGKDPSKVDKTGILLATEIAWTYSRENYESEVLVELNYKIGDAKPVVYINGKKNTTIKIPTLNEFIKFQGLKNVNYSDLVYQGSAFTWILSYIREEEILYELHSGNEYDY